MKSRMPVPNHGKPRGNFMGWRDARASMARAKGSFRLAGWSFIATASPCCRGRHVSSLSGCGTTASVFRASVLYTRPYALVQGVSRGLALERGESCLGDLDVVIRSIEARADAADHLAI